MLKIKYTNSPDEFTQNGFRVTTTSSFIKEDAKLDDVVAVVTQFLNSGEEVEVQVKHKPPKED